MTTTRASWSAGRVVGGNAATASGGAGEGSSTTSSTSTEGRSRMDASGRDQTRRERRRPRRPGPVLAAVHDARLGAAVAQRAGEHARAGGRGVVVVAMVPIADAQGLGREGRLPGGLDDYDDALEIIREVERVLDAQGVAYQ